MLYTVCPGVLKTPEIQGGDACIRGTRIPVWSLVNYRHLGGSDADLLRDCPYLTLDDLHAAWAYAAAHREEIEYAINVFEDGDDDVLD